MEEWTVIYDQGCNLCEGIRAWVGRHETHNIMRFVSYRSKEGQQKLESLGLPLNYLDTVIVFRGTKPYCRSTAFFLLLGQLKKYSTLSRLLLRIPRKLRDKVYNAIARYRVYLFGRNLRCELEY